MHKIFLEKGYKAKAEDIFNLFSNLTIFKLTGTDLIECDFKEGGTFLLKFTERGLISGHITEIINNKKILLEWNVEGFGGEKEIKTLVNFTLNQNRNICTLTLEHSNIKLPESAEAKKRAWTEILENMQSELKRIKK